MAEDPFLALSGASALRGFYTSGIIMHRPDEERPERRLEIELRNGPALPAMLVDKVGGRWVELDPHMSGWCAGRSARAGRRAERKGDVILQLLYERPSSANSTPPASSPKRSKTVVASAANHHPRAHQCSRFEGAHQVPEGWCSFGIVLLSLEYGYLVVEGMQFGAGDGDRGSRDRRGDHRRPTGAAEPFKCPQTSICLPVENPHVWVFPDSEKAK